MVASVDGAGPESAFAAKRPLVAELVGPAGAGKTTLLHALDQRSKRILIGTRPRVQRTNDLPFFARNGFLLLPTFLHLYRNGGRLSWLEIMWMLRLKGWHHLWERQVSVCNSVIILDQGPIFAMAGLCDFDPENLGSLYVKHWWRTMYQQWAAILDLVIWLDAPNDILMERINAREKVHMVKGKSEQEVFEFLASCRLTYERVISTLTADVGGPELLRFDTELESLDETVHGILVAFGLEPSEK